jgi:DNA-binding transcriptional LysR family regulator
MLKLDLQKLQIFCEVARHKSFTRAAEALYLTQPTVSQQVQALERQLGAQLFERLAKEVYLTEAGRVLYAKAVHLLSLANEAEQSVREAAGISAGKLDLGVGVTLATYVLPELLRRFKTTYNVTNNGTVKFEITLGNTETLAQKLLKNEIDLALVGSPMDSHALLETHSFLEDKLVMIVSPSDSWAVEGRTSVSLNELGNRVLLVRERGSALQAFVEQMIDQTHAHLDNFLVMANLEAIKRSAEIGLGAAIVPALSVHREVDAGKLYLLNIEGAQVGRTFVYAHHKDKELSRSAKAFLELVKTYSRHVEQATQLD